jgi:hypothetical protein
MKERMKEKITTPKAVLLTSTNRLDKNLFAIMGERGYYSTEIEDILFKNP